MGAAASSSSLIHFGLPRPPQVHVDGTWGT
jgi:hypothetical protein